MNPQETIKPLDKADLDGVLEVGERFLLPLVDKSILITGASGFVGSWLVESLCHARNELGGKGRTILLNRKATSRQLSLHQNAKTIQIVEGDIRDDLSHLSGIDLVIHAATSASQKLNVDNPKEMKSVIVGGMESLIEFSVQNKCRLVNLSSGAVYGLSHVGERCFSEDRDRVRDQLIDRSQYHQSKIEAEDLLIHGRDSRGLDFVNARLFAFLAPLLPIDTHFAAGNFIRDALFNEHINVNGNGESVRSYLYGTDLATWLFALSAFGGSGESYNIGSPNPLTIRELATHVASTSGKRVQFANNETYGNPMYVPCVEKCQTQFDLTVSVQIEDAIQRTLSWWSSAILNF